MVLVAPLIWMVLAQSPATPLSGTVIGPNGEPVAGADLILADMSVYDPPILARGQSDAAGRFTIERPAGPAAQNRFIAPMLWAVKPGLRLSLTKFPGAMPGAGEPVKVVLGPPGKAEVRVEGPDGEPLAGARVRVERFGQESTNVPDDVVDLIEATTDQNGLAVIDAAANDEVAYIDVRSKAFGIQGRPFFPTGPKPKRVWLRPASSLKGRLLAPDHAMAKGWRVSAYTRSGDYSSPEPETTGFSKGITDDEGRFSFPVIAPGSLQLEFKPPGELPLLPDVPQSLAVTAGRENSLEIPLRPAATIAGVVRERGTGRPVPGVKLWLLPSGGGESGHTETDGQGHYSFRTLAHKAQVIVTDAPPSHVRSGGSDRKEFTIPDAPGPIELAPIEILRAAPPLRFVVRDETGKPVADARITGQSSSGMVMQTTEDTGEFAVSGVAPGGEVTIEARLHDRRTAEPIKAIAGGTTPVIVTIVPGLTLAAEGRVLGPGGTPVAGASVKVEFRQQLPNQTFAFPQPFRFEDNIEIRTGPDGTFRTPRELSRKAKDFRVEAKADGFLSRQTEWISSKGGDRITFPDLILRRSQTFRIVSGRVVDRTGTGEAGAAVFQSGDAPRRTATTTDANGRFRLAEIPSRDAFVFAEKAGFRFGGAMVKPAETSVDIPLARREEPPLAMPRTLPPLLTRAEERTMARELLAPLLAGARSRSLGFAGDSVFSVLARVDPDQVLEMLENRVFTQSTRILDQVALAQLETDPAAAVATLDADFNPGSRALGFLAIADATSESDRARRIEWLDRALAEARRVVGQEFKLELLGLIADRWLELDDLDRATAVIREGQAIVAALPQDKYSHVVEEFANVLAVIDLPMARTIFERKGRTNVSPTDPATINRHLGEVAVRLARINPAEAERLVPGVVPNFWDDTRAEHVLRICRRMARADLRRARKILETINMPTGRASFPKPALLPYGLGLMAAERIAIDAAGARRLLDEAFASLRTSDTERDGKVSYPPLSCVMAELLPLVERLEPDQLQERLWLTVASRESLAEPLDLNAVQARVILAMLVSRYDRAIAEVVIAPALERLPDLFVAASRSYVDDPGPFTVLATFDPRIIVALLRVLPESARRSSDPKDPLNAASLDAQVRLATARMLGLPLEERRQKAIGSHYHPWPLRRTF